MVIKRVNDDWSIEDVSCLLYLETLLIQTKYKGKELVQLTKTVEMFKEILKDEN